MLLTSVSSASKQVKLQSQEPVSVAYLVSIDQEIVVLSVNLVAPPVTEELLINVLLATMQFTLFQEGDVLEIATVTSSIELPIILVSPVTFSARLALARLPINVPAATPLYSLKAVLPA